MPVVRIKASRRQELELLLRSLPAILSGRAADPHKIAHGFRMRMAFMFFSLVKEAFIVKSRGGTDECGIKWPPLSREYLAYTRPMGKGGSGSRLPPVAGKLAPGRRKDGSQKDGFMTKAQLKQWRRIYASALARLSLQNEDRGDAEGNLAASRWARSQAAAIAWARMKRLGVRTKLDVFGNRQVEILRDRGILFNSLSPGVLVESGASADYSAPVDDGGQHQVVRSLADSLYVGTNVDYAEKHHEGIRPLWPRDGRLPDAWWDEILEQGILGLLKIGNYFR